MKNPSESRGSLSLPEHQTCWTAKDYMFPVVLRMTRKKKKDVNKKWVPFEIPLFEQLKIICPMWF